jgi:hypothetical protein
MTAPISNFDRYQAMIAMRRRMTFSVLLARLDGEIR